MKRIFFLFFLCCMTTLATFAQEKKAYTLEDVIPGGNNYFNLVLKTFQDCNGGEMYVYVRMWKTSAAFS